MPLIDSLSRAARSAALALAAAAVAASATRPHYGGTLRVEVREAGETPDPPQSGRLADSTGAFRIERWEPGRRAIFAAAEDAPGGRPFLDAIEISLARPPREQALNLELGKADVVEAAAADARRLRRTWTSGPVRLLALAVGPRLQNPRVSEALALAIDRAAIHSVLLQRHGEPSGALLPQWLSGYAFLFPAAQDLARARALLDGLPAPARAFSLGYDASEPHARAIAERIAVNARDAGLLVSVAPSARADVRLLQARILSLDPWQALAGVAAVLELGGPPTGSGPEALYQAERSLIESGRVIPLFHLPDVYGIGPRVHTWMGPGIGRLGEWRFENVWLEPRP